MAARVVEQLAGAGHDIFERDPGRGELSGRFDIDESRVLVTTLLGTVLKIEALKGHDLVVENIGEKIENGRGEDEVLGGLDPGVEIQDFGFFVVEEGDAGGFMVVSVGVPVGHFEIARGVVEGAACGFKKAIWGWIGNGLIENGISRANPVEKALGWGSVRDRASQKAVRRTRQVGPKKLFCGAGVLGAEFHPLQVVKGVGVVQFWC